MLFGISVYMTFSVIVSYTAPMSKLPARPNNLFRAAKSSLFQIALASDINIKKRFIWSLVDGR